MLRKSCGLRRHQLRLDATPPADWGQRFTVRGRFVQSLLKRPGEFQHWSGQAYAELPRADLSQLRRHVDLPFQLSEGDGAVRAWASGRRAIQSASCQSWSRRHSREAVLGGGSPAKATGSAFSRAPPGPSMASL